MVAISKIIRKFSPNFDNLLTLLLHPPYTAMNCEADLVRHKMFSDKA